MCCEAHGTFFLCAPPPQVGDQIWVTWSFCPDSPHPLPQRTPSALLCQADWKLAHSPPPPPAGPRPGHRQELLQHRGIQHVLHRGPLVPQRGQALASSPPPPVRPTQTSVWPNTQAGLGHSTRPMRQHTTAAWRTCPPPHHWRRLCWTQQAGGGGLQQPSQRARQGEGVSKALGTA